MTSKPSLDDLNLTQEESQRLMSCFEKPEFRSLFDDYLKEISDPKHRLENEMYLRQLEQEQKEAAEASAGEMWKADAPRTPSLLIPQEEFCFRTRTVDKPHQIVYVNVCSSEKVDKLSMTKKGNGVELAVPVSIGVEREEPLEENNSNTKCLAIETVYHPDTIKKGPGSVPMGAWKHQLIGISIENAGKRLGKKLEQAYKMMNMKCKGIPAAQSIGGGGPGNRQPSKPAEAPVPKAKPAQPTQPSKQSKEQEDAFVEMITSGLKGDAPASSNAQDSLKLPGASAQPTQQKGLITELASSKVEMKTPKYEIVHRGTFDMQHYTLARKSSVKVGVPEQLVVRITMPGVNSANEIQLEFEPKSLHLMEEQCGYRMDIELPFPVDSDQGEARFIKNKNTLEVTLPVSIPREELSKYVSLDSPVGYEEEQENEKRNLVQEVASTPAPEQSEEAHVPTFVPEPRKQVSFAEPSEQPSSQQASTVSMPRGSLAQVSYQQPEESSLPHQATLQLQPKFDVQLKNKYLYDELD